MSITIAPPFKLQKLRKVVAGKDAGFPRRAAMGVLLSSGFPNKDQDLAAVLENAREPARIRYLAAVMLAKVDTSAARDLLLRALKIRDKRVRAGVLIGLGRIGDKVALDAITRLKDRSARARFAAALIAHRLGVKGHDLQVPNNNDYLVLRAGAAHPARWQRPAPAEVESCLRSLISDPFGITFTQTPAYQIRCGKRVLMVLFNQEFAAQDAIKRMCERKTLAGVVALKDETNGLYSVSLLILTAPARQRGRVHLLLHNTHGEIVYAGSAQVKAISAKFSIRAVSRPGGVPIRVEGTAQADRLEIKTALSALFVHSRRHPDKAVGKGVKRRTKGSEYLKPSRLRAKS